MMESPFKKGKMGPHGPTARPVRAHGRQGPRVNNGLPPPEGAKGPPLTLLKRSDRKSLKIKEKTKKII